MRYQKVISFFILFLFLTVSVHAQGGYDSRWELTPSQRQRLMAAKQLLAGIDKESLQQTIDALRKTRHFQLNVQMREAMAKTYADIVKEENVVGQKKKEWLYSMVCLNMAYLQFGGAQGSPGSTTDLNRLIRRKLKEYLPENILKQPGFIYSLE